MGAIISFSKFNTSELDDSGAMSPLSHAGACELSHNPLDPNEPQLRTTFGSKPGAIVRGWPSTGRLYVFVGSSVVELDFLGVDRFNSTPRSVDQVAEDAHCSMMRKLGANWYAGNWEYVQKALQPPSPSEPVLVFGWPEGGGVWCLKTSYAKASDISVGESCECCVDERAL